uniref:Zinc metalloproteinase n=1 Tax=Strongyloides stercoralis TaxID=6248 RepID=A0A0K0EB05_STRER
MIIKSVIFLLIFLIAVTISIPLKENSISQDEANDLTLTKELIQFFEEIMQRLMRHYHSKYNNINYKTSKNSNNDNSSIKVIEDSELYQGDIVLTLSQSEKLVDQAIQQAEINNVNVSDIVSEVNKRRRKRKIKVDKYLEWSNKIPYFVDTGVNSLIVDVVLKVLGNKTCLTFNKISVKSDLKEGLRYYAGNKCHSHVGRIYQFTPQDISIGKGCNFYGTVMHETLHSLGLEHEQARADRDSYIQLFIDNVMKGREHNFLKVDLANYLTYEVRYDFGSVMHYDTTAFGVDNKQTMIPLFPYYTKTMGMNEGPSFLDIKLINLHYCKKSCEEQLPCKNGGYTHPHDCKRCVCVRGYEGKLCSEYAKPKPGCDGENVIDVSNGKRELIVNGTKKCIYHILTSKGKKIRMNLKLSVYEPSKRHTCEKRNSLEIKYLEDKTQTGAFFCGSDAAIKFNSRNHHVIVYHRSTNSSNQMKIVFKTLQKN